jgi:hypothetical protein
MSSVNSWTALNLDFSFQYGYDCFLSQCRYWYNCAVGMYQAPVDLAWRFHNSASRIGIWTLLHFQRSCGVTQPMELSVKNALLNHVLTHFIAYCSSFALFLQIFRNIVRHAKGCESPLLFPCPYIKTLHILCYL